MREKHNIASSLLRLMAFLGVAVLWLGVGLAAFKADMSLFAHQPLSYLGIKDASADLFNASLIISAGLFMAFGLYVVRSFTVSRSFKIIYFSGQICQIIVVLVPVSGSTLDHLIHTIFGLALGLSLPLVMIFFASDQRQNSIASPAKIFAGIEIVFCIIGVTLSKKSVAPLAEIIAAFGFDSWVIWLAVYRPILFNRPKDSNNYNSGPQQPKK